MTRQRLLALSCALLASAVAAAHAQGGDEPPMPPPGRLIDVGGWRLHLNCTGEVKPNQPRVILEAGVGDFSVEWGLVQPQVSRFARVCSYDRAGDGWSELGPHPRTFHQIVYELHTLLDKSGEKPPFILVGHSYGGWLVRLYQSTYPSEVTGLLLVEAGADDPLRLMPNGKTVHASELVQGVPIPAVKTTGPLRESEIPPAALAQIRAGLANASARANEPPRDKLPADAQRMRTWALGQVKHVAAAVNPFEIEELAGLRADRMKSDKPLGDLPLVVLTRGLPEEKGPDGSALEAEHRKDHEMIAGMSRRGKLVVATRSGHHIQIDEPDLVASTIQQMLNGSSSQSPRSFSLDTLRRRCIDFTEVKRGTSSDDLADCRVSEFGQVGTIDGQSYYYAIYCLVPNYRLDQGTCADSSYNARAHRNRGLVVFVGERGSRHARVLHERVTGEVGMLYYAKPAIVETSVGRILELPIRVDGTGNYNQSEYYLRKDGAWRRLDFESWQKDLTSRLPAGLAIWKGVWPDLSTMRADAGLYRKGDGNCCPTGGTARVRLALRGTRFVIQSFSVDTMAR